MGQFRDGRIQDRGRENNGGVKGPSAQTDVRGSGEFPNESPPHRSRLSKEHSLAMSRA